jgi:hypothetical protein
MTSGRRQSRSVCLREKWHAGVCACPRNSPAQMVKERKRLLAAGTDVGFKSACLGLLEGFRFAARECRWSLEGGVDQDR